jgi:DnaK suppressor protein
MKKKKPAAKKATMAKKPATKPAAAPAKKPGAAKKPVVAQKAAAKPAAKKVAPGPAPAATGAPRRQTYTPQPIESTGWAPFRYPPQ